MALYPAYHDVYQTIILDQSGEAFLTERPMMELINEACIQNGASYDGRVQAVRHVLPYLRKTPLMISKEPHIFAFPTMSPKHYECTWLFYLHIESFSQSQGKTYVHFKNGCSLEVSCSLKMLHTQRERVAATMDFFAPLPYISLTVESTQKGYRDGIDGILQRSYSSLLPRAEIKREEVQI
jgi:competence protein ComK